MTTGGIVTSRNTTTGEPLSGVTGIPLASQNLLITTPGKVQQATINITNELKKTFNLTPFNVDPAGDSLFRPAYADDVIYGGWGNDFLHGGSGDDAISAPRQGKWLQLDCPWKIPWYRRPTARF